MKKIENKKAENRAEKVIKNILNYFVNHPDGIKKEEYYRKNCAKYDYGWYRSRCEL